MSNKPSNGDPWFKDGLKFKCTGCGKCCGGAPGYVWLTDADIKRLSEHLNSTENELLKNHCRQVGNQYSLKERSVSYDCVFLKDKQCSVYEGRPTQCRTYPFWGKNVSSKKNWDYLELECEGVNAEDAQIIPLETILEKLREGD